MAKAFSTTLLERNMGRSTFLRENRLASLDVRDGKLRACEDQSQSLKCLDIS